MKQPRKSVFQRITKLKDDMANANVQEIDFQNAGTWPLAGRIFSLLVMFSLSLTLGYFFYLEPLEQKYKKAQTKERQLIQSYESKAFQGANLIAYRQQMSEIRQLIQTLSSQLPNDNAIPELIEQIGQQAESNRVDIKALKLQPIEDNELYLAQPIDLEMQGSFHNLSLFIASISGLQRIVTLHDFTLRPGETLLNLRIQAVTYHNKKTVTIGDAP